MARTDNLTHFLTDVANAIREKTGETGTIYARDFDTKISSISGSSEPEITTRLPARYQEVEYIESIDNNNYIDTGVVFPDVKKVRYEFKVKMPSDIRGQAYWGCYMNGGYNGGTLYENRYYVAGDNTLTLALEADGIYEGYAYTDTNTQSGAFYANNGEINETLTYTTGQGLPDSDRAPFCIFCQGTPSGSGISYNNGSKLRVYYFRIYQDDIIVRDFIPCYKKEYNTIGLYDLVNDVFYANQGRGVFEKGEDVNVEIEPEKNFNIFIQEEEPSTKEGIWIQTNDETVKSIDHYNISDRIISAGLGEWDDPSLYTQLPYGFFLSASAAVGENIYLFFNKTSCGYNYTYKYNTQTRQYTQLADVPIDSQRGTAEAIGTDIYLFANSVCYKYDTIQNTYTQVQAPPYSLKNATSAVYQDEIYLFGPSQNACKYNPSNDEYITLTSLPVNNAAGEAITIGDKIYLIGINDNYSSHYVYDIYSNTYNSLSLDISWIARPLLERVDDDNLLILGSSYNETAAKTGYLYTISTQEIQKLTLPYNIGQGESETVGNKIYVLGSRYTGMTQLLTTINLSFETWTDTELLIQIKQRNPYKTMLADKLSCVFYGCAICIKDSTSNMYADIPMYYGDGVQWIKFKN